MDVGDDIRDALEALERVIERRVRQEQLRDQLTGLRNEQALNGDLADCIEREFWIAFVEIDRFKSVNNEFGYENANALLIAVARKLESSCDLFGEFTCAFRAHGDEFFLLGETSLGAPSASAIQESLEVIRVSIGAIKLPVEHADDTASGSSHMSCTVSVSWCRSDEHDATGDGSRGIQLRLEKAMAVAKRTRNSVVHYEPSHEKLATVSLRGDCSECHTTFSFEVPLARVEEDGGMNCPNCGKSLPRETVRKPGSRFDSTPI